MYQDTREKKNLKFISHHGNLAFSMSLVSIIKKVQPDRTYNLLAQSRVVVSFETM